MKQRAAAASDPRQLRLTAAPDSEQKKIMKMNEADTFSDRKNKEMRCPYNKTELDHRLTLFRCKQGVNANKLFWRCEDCDDAKGKKGKLIGMDSELESDGLKTIDASRNSSAGAEKRKTISEDSIVASGRGVNWSQLASDVSVIRDGVLELVKIARYDSERTERLTSSLIGGVGDIISKPSAITDPDATITALANLYSNIGAASAVDHISESDSEPDTVKPKFLGFVAGKNPAPPGPGNPCLLRFPGPNTPCLFRFGPDPEAARTAASSEAKECDAEGGVRDGDSVQKPQS